MIGWHCGERVLLMDVPGQPKYFMAKCRVCKKVFKQRKRQSAKEN